MPREIRQNDSPFGRRSILAHKKQAMCELEAIIEDNTKTHKDRENIRKLCVDVAMGLESFRSGAMKYGLSYHTVNEWKRKGWIYEAVEIAKELAQDKLDRRLTGTINKALNNIDTALDKGDGVLQKDGSLAYKPVSAKDNAIIAGIAFEKRQLLRGEATQISEEGSTGDKLAALAEQFAKFAINNEKVIDGEAVRVEEEDGKDNGQGFTGNTEEQDSH